MVKVAAVVVAAQSVLFVFANRHGVQVLNWEIYNIMLFAKKILLDGISNTSRIFEGITQKYPWVVLLSR